jgi:hypothetical protein
MEDLRASAIAADGVHAEHHAGALDVLMLPLAICERILGILAERVHIWLLNEPVLPNVSVRIWVAALLDAEPGRARLTKSSETLGAPDGFRRQLRTVHPQTLPIR